MIAYWLDYGTVKNLTGEVGLFFMLKKSSTDSIPKVVWRFPIAFQIVFTLITLSTLPFLPDTPRWLYSQGRKDEAVNVLARLMACDEDDQRVQMIQNEMREAINLESEKEKFDWKNLIYDRTDLRNTRRLILCFMIQFMQQFTGINVIAFYGKFPGIQL